MVYHKQAAKEGWERETWEGGNGVYWALLGSLERVSGPEEDKNHDLLASIGGSTYRAQVKARVRTRVVPGAGEGKIG